MNDTRTRRIEEQKRHRKRVRMVRIILTLFVICSFPFLCYLIVSLCRKTAVVELSAQNIEILKGEEMPELRVNVEITKDPDAVLDKESNYTAEDFVNDLNNQKGYTLQCDADPNVEGTYKIKLLLDDDISGKVNNEWKKHLKLTLYNGSFTVKNPVGTWDGDKFKRYDNTYVENDFVESKEKMYYFGEDGVKVTGWHLINNKTYYFNKKGVMQKSGWKKNGEDKYYLGEDGAALTGWQKIKNKSYYFGTNGKMATGEVRIGLSVCKFNKNGKLLSKEKSSIDPDKPMVALTFDDGPGKRTGEILDVLEEYDAHATFFMLGQRISSYESVVKKMKEIGCELGNHSYDHTSLTKLSIEGIKDQINSTNKALKKAAGSEATVMRPPYGAVNDTVKSNVGMPMIMWNIDTLDWKTRDANKTIDAVLNDVEDGDIVLMHDIHSETVDAVIELVPRLEEAGFQMVTVSELAAAKGKEMKNGGRYSDFAH
ncbi:MAG: polysaccharide deacetylase family protein [Lachnospiraceae bacterium]